MNEVWLYTILSVVAVSLIALLGILAIPFRQKTLEKVLLFLVAFAAGGLLGGAFIHLIPETVEDYGFGREISLYVILGILGFFILEKFLHWQHCHKKDCDKHPKRLAIINLVGDGLHNFIDGLVIGGSYLASIPIGIATTIAVLLHEVPQEIGDFGVLVHGGFSRKQAIGFNFLTALTAVFGAILALILFDYVGGLTKFLLPFTAGGFIYIAASDLIPEIHQEKRPWRSFLTLVFLVLGMFLMFLIKD